MNEIYNDLSKYAKNLIDEYFEPCGLKNSVLIEIEDIINKSDGRINPNSNIIGIGLEWAASLAESLARRMNKDICYYIEMAIKHRWLTSYIPGWRGVYIKK